MPRIVLTLFIDIPEGSQVSTPDVDYSDRAPAAVAHSAAADEPELPPIEQLVAQQPGCPVHNVPWKTVPAGVSKKSGKPYESFQACSEMGCNEKPRRAA
jgi:hypothetical protein